MAHLGDVYTSEGKYFAKIDRTEAGIRFKMRGPRREDQQQAAQDLADIRAAASGEASRLEELRAMKLATERLQEEAKAAIRGGTPAVDSNCFVARIKYVEDSIQKSFAGPPRRTERRAKADLAKLRQAAQGQATVTEGIAAMRRKGRELHQEAEFEANVAMGLAQYGFTRDAHKVVDSDPESEGDAPLPTRGDDDDESLDGADFSNPAVVKKFFPPPAPRAPRAPPRDEADATQQLTASCRTAEALRVLLAGRADPNVSTGEIESVPLLPEILSDMREAGLDSTRNAQTGGFSILMRVISLARDEHLKEMFDLLRQYGAKYRTEERGRYKLRWDSIRTDPIYLREFHRSATDYDATKLVSKCDNNLIVGEARITCEVLDMLPN